MTEYIGPIHYIPHHGVTKASSSSTPLRIVFNTCEMANSFNGFFTSIADEILKKLKFEGKSFKDYLTNSLNNSFYIYD